MNTTKEVFMAVAGFGVFIVGIGLIAVGAGAIAKVLEFLTQ